MNSDQQKLLQLYASHSDDDILKMAVMDQYQNKKSEFQTVLALRRLKNYENFASIEPLKHSSDKISKDEIIINKSKKPIPSPVLSTGEVHEKKGFIRKLKDTVVAIFWVIVVLFLLAMCSGW